MRTRVHLFLFSFLTLSLLLSILAHSIRPHFVRAQTEEEEANEILQFRNEKSFENQSMQLSLLINAHLLIDLCLS